MDLDLEDLLLLEDLDFPFLELSDPLVFFDFFVSLGI